MNPAQRLIRKAALDKAASPERLDELMHVTSPAGWVALGALGLMVLAAIGWGVFGTISIKVRGNGILLRGGSLLAVTSDAEGRVQEVLVKPGDVVRTGQPVVRVNQPDLELKIENTRAELAALERQSTAQGASVSGIIRQLEARRASLRETLAKQTDLYNRGLITRGRLDDTQRELASIEQQIEQNRLSGFTGRNSVDDVRRRLRELEQRLKASKEVKSPYSGPVSELQIAVGDLVQTGGRLMTLEPLGGRVTATVYVPARQGKKVKPGMSAQISPDTVRREEYGVLLGKVLSVSSYPVTTEGMLRVLRNEKLASSLAGEGAHFEVVIELARDPKTESGFRWSSSQGPPFPVLTGTGCSGAVRVETRRPVSYVLPILKGLLQTR